MRQKGNSSILIIIVILVVAIVGASAVSYYVLKSQGKAPVATYTQEDYYNPSIGNTSPVNESNTVSSNDDVDTLESELESTQTGSIDSDIYDLNSSASSL